jgi:hypothetical protein
MRRLAVLLTVFSIPLAYAAAGGAATNAFQATFVDIYSQCPISPPSVVFCGQGTIAGYGAAHSTASLTGPLVPLGDGCFALTAKRTITLDDGVGSLTLAETGTKCPPSAAAGQNAQGDPYTVVKTYTISTATGVFAGATGSGSDVNRSAGDSQVSVITGTITLAT